MTGSEISDDKKADIKQYYRNHTRRETEEEFDVSGSTVIKYGEKKKDRYVTQEEKRKKHRERKRKARKQHRKKAIEYLGGECEKCGYNDCPAAFDFHHRIDENKNFGLAGKFGQTSWSKIKNELEKCRLLCANCHRKLHYKST